LTRIIFTLFLAITAAYPQYETIGPDDGVGARAFAMGGAQTALASDFSACYWNPAALTTIRQHELSLCMSYYSLTDTSRYNRASSYTSKVNGLGLQSVGYVHPVPTLQGSLVFALGYSRPANLAGTYAGSHGSFKATGYLSEWNAAAGIMLLKSLSLGTNLHLNTGSDEARAAVPDTAVTQTSSFFGFGVDFGALIEISANLRAGLTATLYDGRNMDRTNDTVIRNTLGGETTDKFYLQSPVKVQAGLGYHTLPFSLEFDVQYVDWENAKYYVGSSSAPFYYPDIVNTLEYRLGTEVLLPLPDPRLPGIKLRAGVSHANVPYASYRSDNGRNSVSGGLSILIDKSLLLEMSGRYSLSDVEYDYGTQFIQESVRNATLFFALSYRY